MIGLRVPSHYYHAVLTDEYEALRTMSIWYLSIYGASKGAQDHQVV